MIKYDHYNLKLKECLNIALREKFVFIDGSVSKYLTEIYQLPGCCNSVKVALELKKSKS